MENIVEIIKLLESILKSDYLTRPQLIEKFQNKIWNDESSQDKKYDDILSGIAYDLDFYEPNENWRRENSSYYGENMLKERITLAIEQLKIYKASDLLIILFADNDGRIINYNNVYKTWLLKSTWS